MQPTSQTQAEIASNQPNLSVPSLKTADMIGILMLTFPLVGILSVVSYRKYRARLIKLQVEALERIWKIDSIEKTQ